MSDFNLHVIQLYLIHVGSNYCVKPNTPTDVDTKNLKFIPLSEMMNPLYPKHFVVMSLNMQLRIHISVV